MTILMNITMSVKANTVEENKKVTLKEFERDTGEHDTELSRVRYPSLTGARCWVCGSNHKSHEIAPL